MSAPTENVTRAPVEAPLRTTASIRKPNNFLCLAPVHSASFPKQPQSPKMSPTAVSMDSAIASPPGSPFFLPTNSASLTHRRSSTSSVGSANEKRRFLKLGPVFWGGAIGENDYAIED